MLKRLLPFIILIAGVSVAEGQTYGWYELGAGTSPLNANGEIYSICADIHGNVYAAGNFTDSSGYRYVAIWNGNAWKELGTGSAALKGNGTIYTISSDPSGKIYAGGGFLTGDIGSYHCYVGVWDGNSWSGLGDSDAVSFTDPISCIYTPDNNHVYVSGVFNYTQAQLGDAELGLTVYDTISKSWQVLGPANYPFFQTSISDFVVSNNNIYALGNFWDTTGQYYVGESNGQISTEIGPIGKENLDSYYQILYGYMNAICADSAGNVYVAGYLDDLGYVSTGVWNGTYWEEIGDYQESADDIYTVVCGAKKGFYIGFYDGDYIGEIAGHVNYWNGTNWSQIGLGNNSLNANGPIDALCTNAQGQVFAAGNFTNANGYSYVAKYGLILDVTLGANQTVCNGSELFLNPLVNGLYPPYSFKWNVDSGNALTCDTCETPFATITQNSAYQVLLTDSRGDTASASIKFTIDSAINQMSLTVNDSSFCDTTIASALVSGANLPYSISWDDNTVDSNIREATIAHDYAVGQTYIISARDSAGCLVSVLDTVPNLPHLLASLVHEVPAGCQNNGQLLINASGGTEPYNFIWSNGQSGDSLSSLAPGLYAVTVTDSNACTSVDTFQLNQEHYYVYMSAANANCSNNGSILTQVYNGAPPYSYLWSNNNTTAALMGLAAGNYFVTVTDANGCSTSGNTAISAACKTIISGIVFIDTSGNCLYSGSQPKVPNVLLNLSGGSETLYATTDNNGNYSFTESDTGTFHVSVQLGNGCGNYTLCGNPSQTITVSGLGDSSINNNFALNPATAGFDLYLHPGWTPGNPGFEKDYWIYFGNESPIPYNGPVTVAFKYDSNLVFLSSDIPYTTFNSLTDSITWLVTNFDNSTWDRIGDIRFKVPDSLALTYQLHGQFWIFPYTGDCDTSNNYLNYYDPVKGSHDPNAKTVSPGGTITNSDSELTYTIYYQNTGTDSTYFIIVKDTLSPYLNPATVQNLAGTDKYSSFTISGNGILTWVFNPLRLVDSATNTTGSKGFIVYSVKPFANTPVGTHIANSASVYFDYNPPVVTDTIMSDFCSSTVTSLSASICNGEIYPVGFVTHSQTGNFMDTIQNINGCDSIINLQLTVLPVSSLSINTSICGGEAFYVGNIMHNQPGYYIDTIQNVYGCDSIVSLRLAVLQPTSANINANICNGESYYVGNIAHNQAGNYVDTIQNSGGCDSIVSLQLTVLQSSVANVNASICNGETYFVGNIAHNTAGNFTDTLQNVNGCDSIVSLQLAVLQFSVVNINASICNGETYFVGNIAHNVAGNFTDTLQNVNGCDSIVSLQLTVLQSSSTNINTSICDGERYAVGNMFYSQTGSYSDTLQNSYGCDSIVSLQLSVDTVTARLSQPSPDTLIVIANGNIAWLDCGNNQLVEGATANTFIPQASGTYAAIVSNGNCSDTTDCTTAVVNGIQAINNAHVHIYPNPTSNLLNIVLNRSTSHTISLYDMKGSLLTTYHYQGSFEQLDLSRYSDGVYFIAINADEWFVRQKVVRVE